jgi:curli production assembly/transport component CsgE
MYWDKFLYCKSASRKAHSIVGLLILLLMACLTDSSAQRLPAKAPTKTEALSSPLPAKKLEEALQLLLKATGDSTHVSEQRRQFKPTEIDGLVLDQTISKVGHDFYDQFYSKWEVPQGIGDYTINIREKPGRATSILISVEVNDNELLELPIQPKAEIIEDIANYALETVTNFLLQAQNQSQQLERGGRQPLEVF